MNVSGGLFSPSGAPITNSAVKFKLEVWDHSSSCLLYSEEHHNQDLSQSKGGFSLPLGKGVNANNLLEGSAVFSPKIFENGGAVAGGWPDCASGTTLASGDDRVIRVYYDLGGGYVAMSPDVPVSSAAFAMVADTLQGKRPADFVQVRDDMAVRLSQSNLEDVFSSSNYTRLQQLLNPSAAVPFAGQRLSNLADPSAGSDAATKNYADGYLGGQAIDLADVAPGAGGGKILTWDQTAAKWIATTLVTADNTKLPLAGGTMNGVLDMGGQNILATGHITVSPGKVVNLGALDDAGESALGLGTSNAGAIWFNTQQNTLRVWNGSSAVGVGTTGAAGGDLAGTYPNPRIADDAVTSSKLNGSGIATNRLVITDGTTGNTLTYANCANDEILKYITGTGWQCASVASLSAVTSVNGKSGNVVLNGADLGLGTASMRDVGTGAGDLPELDAGGKIDGSLLPEAGGDLSGSYPNPDVIALRGKSVSATAPSTTGQMLRWNTATLSWEPSADGSALTALNASNLSSGTVAVARFPALTGGDVTNTAGSGALNIGASKVTTVHVAEGAITTAKLSDTAVTPNTYGSGTQVAQITVDAKGRITGAANVAITGAAPTGAAGGDLGGNFPNPDVIALRGKSVSATAPSTTGQMLRWNTATTSWEPSTDGSALTALNASNISSGTLNVARFPALSGGDVTSAAGSGALNIGASKVTTAHILDGTIATADVANGAITAAKLANTAVTPNTYGSGTQVAQFTVDAQGRITGAANVAITGAAPTGAAGGDLAGTFPNPTVDAIRGSAVSATAPTTTGQMLRWNTATTSWEPSTDGSALTALDATNISSGTLNVGRFPALTGGDVTSAAGSGALSIGASKVTTTHILDGTIATADIANGAVTAAKLANTAVTPNTYGTGTQVAQFTVDAQGRITGASNVAITGAAPTGAAGGDLGGNFPNPDVTALRGSTVSATAPATTGQVLRWNNATTSWEPSTDGSALTALNATNISSGTLNVARFPAFTGGDVTSAAGSGALNIGASKVTTTHILDGTIATADLANAAVTAAKLANTAVTPNTYGSGTQVAQFTVDAQGRITGAANVAITGAAPTGAAGGDLGGNFPNPDVIALRGKSVSATAPTTTGQMLRWNTATTSWEPSTDGSALTALNATNISTGTLNVARLPALTGGDVTSAAGSGALSIGNTRVGTAHLANGAVTAAKLANTAVTPNTYGSGTQVAQITVDAQGRITGASNVAITGAAPTGAAGGDLGGNFPNPTVNAIRGSAVSATAPTATGQILRWNTGTTSWEPSTDGSALTALNATNISAGTLNVARFPALTGGDVTSAAGSGALSIGASKVTTAHILDGTIATADLANSAVTDAKISTVSVAKVSSGAGAYFTYRPANTACGDGEFLMWDNGNSRWICGGGSGGASGAAGGDLAGSYPNPTIAAGVVTNAKMAAGAAVANIGYTPVNKAGDTMSGRLGLSPSGFQVATKDDISTRTDSGFFETSSATIAEGWPMNATYMQVISGTHVNTANYYATQFAGDIYNSNNIFYRATNNSGATAWNRVYHSGNLTNLNQLANGPGYISAESDTLNSVVARGATTASAISVGGLTSSGVVSANAGISVDGQAVIDDGGGWHRTYGQTGWYNGTYAGGMYMTDTSYVRTYGGKGLYVDRDGSTAAVTGSNSGANYGVYGYSATSYGVYGSSGSNYGVTGRPGSAGLGGVLGYTQDATKYGILGYNNAYSFYGSGAIYNSGNVSVTGTVSATSLTVDGGNSTTIRLQDADEAGYRYIHANSAVVGFLNNSSAWMMYVNDAGQIWTPAYGWLHSNFSGGTKLTSCRICYDMYYDQCAQSYYGVSCSLAYAGNVCTAYSSGNVSQASNSYGYQAANVKIQCQ